MESLSRPKRILFLCTHNSARSQMAEGLLRALGHDDFIVESAGTVATQVRSEAITVMAELGINMSNQQSKTLARFLSEPFDEVITVCDQAHATCPAFPGAAHRRHWSIADPTQATGSEEELLAAFRTARDTLRQRIETELIRT